jgi:amidase
MMSGSAIHDLSALELAAAIRRRELSPVEVADHYLDRIAEHDRRLGAFVTVTEGLAREQAAAAERALLDRSAGAHPPLLGVPVPVKDLTRVAGVRCTFGSAAFADNVAEFDDGVAARLREAGCVLLGKTNAAEFGISCYTENAVAPPARTPWDLSRSAGGSSGGAGAAVAGGLAPVAHGNDGGGSVRIPASACGLVGLKPTRGRVSGGPLQADPSGLPADGVIARTVRDAAALLDAMAATLPGDPCPTPPLPPGESFLAAADREPGRLRVGCWRAPVLADADLHPQCAAAYEQARALLADLGHDVGDAPAPFDSQVTASFEVIWSVLAQLAPVPPDGEARLLPITRWLRSEGARRTGADYAGAVVAMQLAVRAAAVAWAPYDVLLAPTLARPPAAVGGIRNDADPAADFAAQKAFSPYCATYNVTGQPAIQLPLYWTDADLPIGVQLAGRSGDEATLIALAAQVEAAHPWAHRRPPAVW